MVGSVAKWLICTIFVSVIAKIGNFLHEKLHILTIWQHPRRASRRFKLGSNIVILGLVVVLLGSFKGMAAPLLLQSPFIGDLDGNSGMKGAYFFQDIELQNQEITNGTVLDNYSYVALKSVRILSGSKVFISGEAIDIKGVSDIKGTVDLRADSGGLQ